MRHGLLISQLRRLLEEILVDHDKLRFLKDNGESEKEGRTLRLPSRWALQPNFAAMILDYVAADGQAETGAAVAIRTISFCPEKSFENSGLVLHGDPRPVIEHLKGCHFGANIAEDAYRASRLAVFDSVFNQVPEHLL